MGLQYVQEEFGKLKDEATENYKTGRFQNAARIYDNLVKALEKEGMYVDMIYFSYRAANARERAEDIPGSIKTFQILGYAAYMQSLKIGMAALNKPGDNMEKLGLINLMLESTTKMQLLDLGDKLAKTMEDGMWKIYWKTKDENIRVNIVEKLEKLAMDHTSVDNKRILEQRIALLLDSAEQIEEVKIEYDSEGKRTPLPIEKSGLNEAKADKLLQAARGMIDLRQNSKKIELILRQVMSIDANTNNQKHGFPEFKNEAEIKDYLGSVNQS